MKSYDAVPMSTFAEAAAALYQVADRLAAAAGPVEPFTLTVTMTPLSLAPVEPASSIVATIDQYARTLGIESGTSPMTRYPIRHYDAAGVISGARVSALVALVNDEDGWHDAREETGELWMRCPDEACTRCRPAPEGQVTPDRYPPMGTGATLPAIDADMDGNG